MFLKIRNRGASTLELVRHLAEKSGINNKTAAAFLENLADGTATVTTTLSRGRPRAVSSWEISSEGTQ